MQYPLYQVDAFTDHLFGGNPAAVVPLKSWLTDEAMQLIARENNLAETAFFVPLEAHDQFHIRWFTPTTEVNLCGHATLATAFVVFNCLKINWSDTISFQSKSGWLHVTREGELLTLDFPTDSLESIHLPEVVREGFSILPQEAWMGREDCLLLFHSEAEVLALKPDFKALAKDPVRGFIATAPGEHSDFVSRCFFPGAGIDEDPVTGSAHTTLTPFWASKTGKTELSAIQVSERRGYLQCSLQEDRVLISGKARLFLEGRFWV
jgi:PhzF family phenazine biosynthesis protein